MLHVESEDCLSKIKIDSIPDIVILVRFLFLCCSAAAHVLFSQHMLQMWLIATPTSPRKQLHSHDHLPRRRSSCFPTPASSSLDE
jgi:hypothetical protein